MITDGKQLQDTFYNDPNVPDEVKQKVSNFVSSGSITKDNFVKVVSQVYKPFYKEPVKTAGTQTQAVTSTVSNIQPKLDEKKKKYEETLAKERQFAQQLQQKANEPTAPGLLSQLGQNIKDTGSSIATDVGTRMSNIGEDISNINNKTYDITGNQAVDKALSGPLGGLQAGFRTAGNLIGSATDVVTDVAKGGLKQTDILAGEVLGTKPTEKIKEGIKMADTSLSNVDAYNATKDKVKLGLQELSKYAADHPELMKNISSTLDILSVLPTSKVVKGTGEIATKGATKVLEQGAKVGTLDEANKVKKIAETMIIPKQTPKEIEKLVQEGKVTQQGLFTKSKVIPTDTHMDIAQDVAKHIVNPGDLSINNIVKNTDILNKEKNILKKELTSKIQDFNNTKQSTLNKITKDLALRNQQAKAETNKVLEVYNNNTSKIETKIKELKNKYKVDENVAKEDKIKLDSLRKVEDKYNTDKKTLSDAMDKARMEKDYKKVAQIKDANYNLKLRNIEQKRVINDSHKSKIGSIMGDIEKLNKELDNQKLIKDNNLKRIEELKTNETDKLKLEYKNTNLDKKNKNYGEDIIGLDNKVKNFNKAIKNISTHSKSSSVGKSKLGEVLNMASKAKEYLPAGAVGIGSYLGTGGAIGTLLGNAGLIAAIGAGIGTYKIGKTIFTSKMLKDSIRKASATLLAKGKLTKEESDLYRKMKGISKQLDNVDPKLSTVIGGTAVANKEIKDRNKK